MKGFLGAVSFFTVIPLKSESDFRQSIVYYFTSVGLLTGSLSGGAFFIVRLYFSGLAASSISVALLLILTGFNHLDGVLDSGDALMAHVPAEQKRTIIKDRSMGAGAIGMATAVYLPFFAFLTTLAPVQGFLAIFLSELASKFTYILLIHYSDVFTDGIASIFKGSMSESWGAVLLANIIPLAVLAAFVDLGAIMALLVSIGITPLMRKVFYSSFEGINGDLVALNGEIVRMVFVVAFAAFLKVGILTGIPLYQLSGL